MKKIPKWLKELIHPDVIKLMQIKFVAMAMTILIFVFIIMLTAINMIMKTVSQSQSMELLKNLAESARYNTLSENMRPPEMQRESNFTKPSETRLAELEETAFQALAWKQEDDYNEEYFPPDWRRREDDFPDNDWDDRPDWDKPWRDDDDPPEDWQETQPFEQPQPPETEPITVPPEETQPPATQPVAEPVNPPEVVIPETPPAPAEETLPGTSVTAPETTAPLTTAMETQTTSAESTANTTTSSNSTTTTAVTTTTETRPPEPPNDDEKHFHMEMKPDRWKVDVVLDHFALMADTDGNFLGIRNTEDYTDTQAEEILSSVLSIGKKQGMYGWLQYYTASKEYGTLIVLTDKSSDQELLNKLFRTTVIIGIIMLIILFIFLVFFSRWITAPVRTALQRQKQFVSDASHELKTPLAVLTANADILQDEIGENKWLTYMQEQTARMNQLVGDLLRLARMDNATQEYEFQNFNLSTAIEATALPFESQAFELHKNLEIDIQPDIDYTGSQQHIRQLAAIFIDNAMKYSNPNGTIKITLLQRGENKILEFYNTGCEISQEETDKIFERFYRGDKARNNKGKNGYGLGLAIAKSIMDIHKIKIKVTCKQGEWIRFLMTL